MQIKLDNNSNQKNLANSTQLGTNAVPIEDSKESLEDENLESLNKPDQISNDVLDNNEDFTAKELLEDTQGKNTESDKQIKKESDFVGIWKKFDGIASWTAIISNVTGAFLELMNIPDKTKKVMSNAVDKITNVSFLPYGLDGMRKAFFENKNPYMFLGFLMELTMVWMSDLKNKYLIRGAATATDQIWVATQHKLMDKDADRFKDGKFQSWSDGLLETPKACVEMLKDIVKSPIKVLTHIDPKKGTGGYFALLSSIGSFASTVGYLLTRNEKLFGTIRDISGVLFDWEMLLDSKTIRKFSGAFFIAESALDFAAKFIEDNSTRLFVNMLSHASGRQALQLYKNSNLDKDEQSEEPDQDKLPSVNEVLARPNTQIINEINKEEYVPQIVV